MARLLHFASVIICLIVVASFVLFAINQTSGASAHQQQVLNGESERSNTGNGANSSTGSHKSAIRKALDDASSSLTSPFSEVFAGSNSEWTKRGARLLLALAVYGFGLGYLGRMIRVRV